MLNVNQLVGFGAGDTTGDSNITFTGSWIYFAGGGLSGGAVSMNLGVPHFSRKIIVIICSNDGVAHSITGTPTLAGIPMTPLVQQNGVRMPMGVWIVDMPTGTSGVVAWTTNDGDVDGQHVATYALYGISSAVPVFSQALFYSGASIYVPVTGAAMVAVSWSWQAGAGTYGLPIIADLTNAYAQGLLSCGHLQLSSPIMVSPGLSVPYNGGLFVAAWS